MTLREAVAILEINPDGSEAEATKTYRDLVRVWHPDNFATKPDLLDRATAKTRQLNEAWEIYQGALSGVLPEGDRTEGPWIRRPSRHRVYQTLTMGILGLLVVVGAIALVVTSDLTQPELRLAKELARISFETNKNLPMSIDDETLFTATFAGPGKRFTSVYTLKNVTREQVGPSYFEQVKPALLAHVKSMKGRDEGMKTFESQGITLAFAFRDKDGNDVITISVSPQDYAAP